MRSKFINYIGQKFHKLFVLDCHKDEQGVTRFKCLYDCGNIANIRCYSVISGNTKSCGCNHHLSITKHNMRYTRFYSIWHSMRRRCDCLSGKNYHYYHSKGIRVCDRWYDFLNFKKDMYESYLKHVNEFGEKNTTIDRIDNNKGYSLDNCRWATQQEQQENKCTSRLITFKGETHTIRGWAKIMCVCNTTLRGRINRGWPIEKALTTLVKGGTNE